jgi:hypothetical protein
MMHNNNYKSTFLCLTGKGYKERQDERISSNMDQKSISPTLFTQLFSPLDIHYFKFCIDFRSCVIKVGSKYFLCELVEYNFVNEIECRLMFTGTMSVYAKEFVKLTTQL